MEINKSNKKEKVVGNITEVSIDTCMKNAMYEYGTYVIATRAIPRCSDGFLISEGRVIYGMYDLKNDSNGPFKKSVRSVGHILGTLHPHGDTSLYGTMIKLSQTWKTRIPLVDVYGNNGNITGDSAAAMRYTEARLSPFAKLLTADLNMDAVDMVDNYDGTLKEPTEIPTRLPLLLINGATGMCPGFATNHLPHNPYDSVLLCKSYNLNRDMTIGEMIKIIKAPDFPTGGIIVDLESIHRGYETGSGSAKVKGIVNRTEDTRGNVSLEITCLPPETSLNSFKEKVADLIKNGEIKVKTKPHDYTDGNGIRYVIQLSSSENPKRVENLLYTKARLRTSSKIATLALIKDREKENHLLEDLADEDVLPTPVNLEMIVKEFIKFRESVVYRRSKFKLNKAEDQLHLQKGLRIAFENLDAIIKLIRLSKTDKEAIEGLVKKYKLSESQANYILDMKIRRLTSLESDIVDKKIKDLENEVDVLTKVTKTKSNRHITKIIDEEFDEVLAMLKKYKMDKRITSIKVEDESISEVDSIREEDRVIVLTSNGRIKNMAPSQVVQNRAGSGSSMLGDDEMNLVVKTSTTSTLLFFTNTGKVYSKLCYKIDTSSKAARGSLAKTLLGLSNGEEVVYIKSIDRDMPTTNRYLLFVTKCGLVKKTAFNEYTNIKVSGKRAIRLTKDDSVIHIATYDTDNAFDMLMTTRDGYSIRVGMDKFTPTGRDTYGVVGIKLRNKTDYVVAGIVLSTEYVFFLSEDGLIKKVKADEFNKQARGGFGVCSGKNIVSVLPDTDVLHTIAVYTKQGMNIVIDKSSIRKVSRTSNGVKSIRLNSDDKAIKMLEME